MNFKKEVEENHPLQKERFEEELDDGISDQPTTKYKWHQINLYILPAKMAYFFEAARRISYTPTLVLFLTSIGLSKSESGFIAGCRLLGMMLGGPFWGMIADKWHCHRTIVIITCLSSVLMMCSQPFVSVRYGDAEINKCRIIDNNIIQNCSVIGNCSYHQFRNTSTLSQNLPQGSEEKYGRLFFVMFFMYLVVSFFEGSPVAFVDTATLRRTQLSTHRKINYGKQRMFAAFGGMFGIVLANLCIDYFPSGNVTCYSGMFIAYAIFTSFFMVTLIILYRGLSFKTEDNKGKQKESLRKMILKTMQNRDVAFLYLTTFISGMIYSPYSSFMFLFLKDLGAPSILLTISLVTAASSAVFGFFFSNRIIKMLGGTWKTCVFTLLLFIVRYIGSALITNPWWILIFQPTQALTFCLFLPAALNHLKEICPVPIITSMVSIFNSLYFGVGTIVGSSISGVIYEKYSGQILFFGAAFLSLIWMLVVVMYIVFVLRSTNETEVHDTAADAFTSDSKFSS